MNKWALLYLGLGVFTAVGCNVEVIDGEADSGSWDGSSSVAERAQEVCEPYCNDLVSCGVLSESSVFACIDLCEKRYIEDEYWVSEGCECVIDAGCIEENSIQCEGAPLPEVWTDHSWGLPVSSDGGSENSTGGSTAGGGGTGGSVGGAPIEVEHSSDGPSCTNNHQCGLGEDCIEEQCLARCAASCQCQEGQACEEGYCRAPEEPKIECESTCDCTAGDQCVALSNAITMDSCLVVALLFRNSHLIQAAPRPAQAE
jgi:hypothetical protein